MRLPILMLAFAGCDYTAPIEPPLDPAGEEKPLTNVISGEVVLATSSDQVGPVIVFVTAADNPMPPYGTGRPVAVTTVSPTEFTGGAAGMQSAPFSVSSVPDGEYVLTALMDLDGDFNPLSAVLAGATCGDIGGAHLEDLDTQSLGVATVSGGAYLDDVTIVLASEFPLERPAFVVDGFGEGGNQIDAESGEGAYTLASTEIKSEILDITGPEQFGVSTTCASIFPIYAPDADGNGQYDPHPNPSYAQAGLYDVWPRVYISYLGEPVEQADGTVTYENTLATGESWAGENVPYPTYTLLGTVPAGGTVYEPTLDVMWLPGVVHTTVESDGTVKEEVVTDPAQIPRGAWSITVISFTGQSWTAPNDLYLYGTTDDGFDETSQLQWLQID